MSYVLPLLSPLAKVVYLGISLFVKLVNLVKMDSIMKLVDQLRPIELVNIVKLEKLVNQLNLVIIMKLVILRKLFKLWALVTKRKGIQQKRKDRAKLLLMEVVSLSKSFQSMAGSNGDTWEKSVFMFLAPSTCSTALLDWPN